MKVMILMVTVLFPDLQAHTNAMYALNGELDLEHCVTKDIPRFLEEYTEKIPYALDIHARCVIIDKDRPVNPEALKDKKVELKI